MLSVMKGEPAACEEESGSRGGCRDCWRGKSGREKRYRLEEEGGRNLYSGGRAFVWFFFFWEKEKESWRRVRKG